jgi:hypothetical protein
VHVAYFKAILVKFICIDGGKRIPQQKTLFMYQENRSRHEENLLTSLTSSGVLEQIGMKDIERKHAFSVNICFENTVHIFRSLYFKYFFFYLHESSIKLVAKVTRQSSTTLDGEKYFRFISFYIIIDFWGKQKSSSYCRQITCTTLALTFYTAKPFIL